MNKNIKDTIMLIDNDTLLTDDIAVRLSSIGFDVLTANSEEDALKLLDITMPSIIMLDILMKGKDRRDILRSIKSKTTLSYVPIIVLTSDNHTDSIVHAFLQGVNDYIIKPFVFEEVLARINSHIKSAKNYKELESRNNDVMKRITVLEQIATTDSLTGLFNKGYIIKRLENEIMRASRYKEGLSLIILDIDHFKYINDSLGHLFGDKILAIASKRILDSVRDVDIVARYGGDEFFVICPNTDLKGAKILAERIRRNIETLNFDHDSDVLSGITVSLGISYSKPIHDVSIDSSMLQLISEADIALYRAKSAGRNKSEVYSNSIDAINLKNSLKHISEVPIDKSDNFTH